MIMSPNRLHLLSLVVLLLSSVASEVILVGKASSPTFSRRSIAEGESLVMNDPIGADSTLKTHSVLGGDVAGDADVDPTPADEYQWFVRLLAIWGILLAYRVKARKWQNSARQAASNESTEQITPARQLTAECSATEGPLLREVLDGYNRLRDGTASTEEVDELRRNARSLLEGRGRQAQHELQEVKELLDWLDNARTSGRITITVEQLRERKMGSWDIECGIDAGGQTIKAKKNVKGSAEVDACFLNIPWDADGGIKIWMHLTDSGYENCWGHFRPITMSSAEVLQDPSGMLRAFYTDHFDKDFKLVFKIQRNFSPLPSFDPTNASSIKNKPIAAVATVPVPAV
jgi:hypothetical protein